MTIFGRLIRPFGWLSLYRVTQLFRRSRVRARARIDKVVIQPDRRAHTYISFHVHTFHSSRAKGKLERSSREVYRTLGEERWISVETSRIVFFFEPGWGGGGFFFFRSRSRSERRCTTFSSRMKIHHACAVYWPLYNRAVSTSIRRI